MKTLLLLFVPVFAFAADVANRAEIVVDDAVIASYSGRFDGERLVVQVSLAKGWHTFAMDNKVRSDEKLAGRKALSADRPTEFLLTGLSATGGWLQPEPRDFSKPELRIFSWGFEEQVNFAVAAIGSGPATVRVKAQACTEAICKNIDATFQVVTGARSQPLPPGLIPVRTK